MVRFFLQVGPSRPELEEIAKIPGFRESLTETPAL
jgi:hypothetical protein